MSERFLDMLSGVSLFVIIAILLISALIYFIPSIIAVFRDKKQKLVIFIINLFIGWTVVGWLTALIWAALKEKTDGENIKP